MSSCESTNLDATTLKLDVELSSASYPIFWGENAPAYFVNFLKEHYEASRVVIIADENTAELFGVLYESMFISAGFEVVALTVTAGETVKNWNTAGQLLEAFAQNHVERRDLIVSLGGGVISDLAGFVASVYQRGVHFAQISTSLLSMVDASVGGKTGVDLEAGKNLAGAFKQPVAILMDSDTLATLPESEYVCGLAEVCKTALLEGDDFVDFLLEHAEGIRNREAAVVREMVTRCIAFKASVVAQDEHDFGARECLNYGHTLGHAIEKVLGYGAVSHGAAIAQGMRFAARVSAQVLGADLEFVRKQDQLLDVFGIAPMSSPADSATMMEAMRNDKKVRSGAVRMVLVTTPGTWQCVTIDETTMYDHLNAWAHQPKEA